MTHPVMHSHGRPRRTRAASARARGLEPEVTARPRPFANEVGYTASDDSVLALEPEDLGSHFLSEAVTQGDLGAHESSAFAPSQLEDTELDELPDSDTEIAYWSHLVERAAHGDRDTTPLREAARAGAFAQAAARSPALKREHALANAVRVTDSNTREGSLLDREGAEAESTVAPELEVEDGGRHARVTHDR